MFGMQRMAPTASCLRPSHQSVVSDQPVYLPGAIGVDRNLWFLAPGSWLLDATWTGVGCDIGILSLDTEADSIS